MVMVCWPVKPQDGQLSSDASNLTLHEGQKMPLRLILREE